MSDFVQWFERSCGEWVSHRRYLYGAGCKEDSLSVEFSIERKGESSFELQWSSERNEGVMGFEIEGDEVIRSRGYYGEENVKTRMERVDEDTVVFWSSYGGMDYREEIRYYGGGRLRQTVALKSGKVVLVGQYWECRKENK